MCKVINSNEVEIQIQIYEHLAQSKEDIKNGRTQEADEVFEEIKKELKAL